MGRLDDKQRYPMRKTQRGVENGPFKRQGEVFGYDLDPYNIWVFYGEVF